ncbi:MAG: hypothetical protein H0W48_00060 [Methylibium sp.]|nr:hypothetical protein [Methylibium sp.]
MAKQDIDHDETPDERAMRLGESEQPEADPNPAALDDEDEHPVVEAAIVADTPKDEPAPVVVAEDHGEKEPDQPDQPDAAQYRIPDTADLLEQRKALRAEKAAIESKWSSGELSDEDKATQANLIDDKLDALLIQQTRAETLREANDQHRQQRQQEVLQALLVTAKKDGLDYADTGLGSLYDIKLGDVLKDEAFTAKSFAEQAAEAHARVLKAIGKSAAPVASAPAPVAAAPAAPKPRAIPPTLGDMPAAAAAPIGNDALTEMAAIMDPDEAEARMERMPQSQRTALLRSTMVR